MYSRKPFPSKFVILYSLGEHALKNYVILELQDFLGGDRITRFLHLHYTPLYATIFVTFMPSICFVITMICLGLQTYMRCLSLHLDLQYYGKVTKLPKDILSHDFFQRNLEGDEITQWQGNFGTSTIYIKNGALGLYQHLGALFYDFSTGLQKWFIFTTF